MTDFLHRTFLPADVAAVGDLQAGQARVQPDAQVVPGEAYLSPAFDHGRNVACAFEPGGRLAGYAPLYPVLAQGGPARPHTLWAEVRVQPDLPTADQHELKDRLFDWLVQRAHELTAPFPGHPVRLTFEYCTTEVAASDYVLAKGCHYTESVYALRRDLACEIPLVPAPDGLSLRPWRMESDEEQRAYVAARNQCFPEAPVTLEEWQYFRQSPLWAVGTTLAAFDGEQLVGNVALFWDEAENLRSGQAVGYTEYIFVLPAWRGRNLARALITQGLLHLRASGLAEAQLAVRATNQNALGLYTSLGYALRRESRFYVLDLSGADL